MTAPKPVRSANSDEPASTSCGSGCERSATSTPASIASCSAGARTRAAASHSRCSASAAGRPARRRAARPGGGDRARRALPGLVSGVARRGRRRALSRGPLSACPSAAASFVASLGDVMDRRRALRHRRIALARRARVCPSAAGSSSPPACLVYLTFWWRTPTPASAGRADLDGLCAAVAVAISLLLGHAVTVTALAVTWCGRAGCRRRACPWRIAGGVVRWAARSRSPAPRSCCWRPPASDRPASRRPPLTVVERTPSIVIAIDGFDPRSTSDYAAEPRRVVTRVGRPCSTPHAPTSRRRIARSRAPLDDDRDRRAAGGARRHAASRRAGSPGSRARAGRRDRAAQRDRRRHRLAAADPAGDRQQRRAAREDVLGGRRAGRARTARRELVGDVARAGTGGSSSPIARCCGWSTAARSTPRSRRPISTSRCESSLAARSADARQQAQDRFALDGSTRSPAVSGDRPAC